MLQEELEGGSRIWYRDPQRFLADTSVSHFFPSRDEPLVDQLNATMRFAVYLSLILFVIKRDPNMLFIGVAVGAVTYVVHESRRSDDVGSFERMKSLDLGQEPDGKVCVKPTRDNPFMNVNVNQIRDFPNRPPACDPMRKKVKAQMEKEFDHDLYRDVDDVFGRNSSSRQFYTMPSTTIPNDSVGFAEWLYKPRGRTCKEGNGLQCSRLQLDGPY